MISPGKTFLRGRTGTSTFFYNPIEYLQASLGLCIGGKLIDYCRFNDLNPAIFQSVIINTKAKKFDLDLDTHIVTIQRPETLDKEHLNRIENEITNCTIAKQLINPIVVEWTTNDIPIEELIKEEKKGGCCGS
jgi:hypothetical protein